MQLTTKLLTIAVALSAAVSLMAGGFVLQIGKPSANSEAQAKNAVLMLRGVACVDQEKTTITGTAEGFVNGTRRSIPLKLIPLSGQTVFAVMRQWPNEGKWVLTFVMTNPRFQSSRSALVRVAGASVDWAQITPFERAISKDEVSAALNSNSVAAR